MPVNWGDPSEVQQFKEAAISQGTDPAKLQDYIDQKTTGVSTQSPDLSLVNTAAPQDTGSDSAIPSADALSTPTVSSGALNDLSAPESTASAVPDVMKMPSLGTTAASTPPVSEMAPSAPAMSSSMKMPSLSALPMVNQPMMSPQAPAPAAEQQAQPTILGARGEMGRAALARQSADVFSGGINRGRDVRVPVGTSLAAPPGDWVVTQAFGGATRNGRIGDGTNSGYGNSVVLQNKATGETLRMSHMQQGSVAVKPGQELKGGAVVGKTGVTGNTSGPHLDIEYKTSKGKLADIMNSPYGKYLMPR